METIFTIEQLFHVLDDMHNDVSTIHGFEDGLLKIKIRSSSEFTEDDVMQIEGNMCFSMLLSTRMSFEGSDGEVYLTGLAGS